MSINSLANAAAARRPDTVPLNAVPQGLGEIAKAAATPPTTAAAPAAAAAAPAQPAVETAFNLLFGYIPTEILTLYVAVLAAIQQPHKETSAQWIAFGSFFVATPIVVWLVYAAKVKALQLPLPLRFRAWPVWEMFAAFIAYCAWALALPNTPFAEYEWYSSALSGVVVLVASAALGLIAPFFQRRLSA
jgi:hypothetical protein